MTRAGTSPLYSDDQSVADDEELWRRIPASMVTVDGQTGHYRPQSGMFSDSSDGSPMSAHRAGRYSGPTEASVGDHLMVALNVGFLRSLQLGVATEPPTDDPGHVWVFGRKTASTKRRIATHATWVIAPQET